MYEETFAEGDSCIHRLDPRIKAIVAACFATMTAVADRWPALLAALALSVALVLAARLSVRGVAKRLAVINGFILFLWLVMPFTYPGEALFRLGPLAASREGTGYALLITIKSNAIVLACIALLSTSHLVDLGRALSTLKVPDKLINVLLFMLRYLGETWREYQRLRTAMKVRSFHPRTNLQTYRAYANMIGMLLVSCYSRAEAVYAAMLCRGFRGKFHSANDFELGSPDIFFAFAAAAGVVLVALLQWMHLPA